MRLTRLSTTIFICCHSVDATKEQKYGRKLGRLVNHGRHDKNAVMKVVECDGTPALALFALKNLKHGEEILYDYGIDILPWEKVSNEQSSLHNFQSNMFLNKRVDYSSSCLS